MVAFFTFIIVFLIVMFFVALALAGGIVVFGILGAIGSVIVGAVQSLGSGTDQ